MRIIAGKYKNRSISAPEGLRTRPILSRVRKSLFDTLQPYLEGARFLDLFSGTGVMALEAFSRGASFVYSIDSSPAALEAAQINYNKICPDQPYRLVRGDVLLLVPRLTKQEEPFDVIGVTPPYGQDLANKTLALLDQHSNWLKNDTVVYVQREKTEDVKLEWQNLEHVRTKTYGKTVLEFFMPFEK
ncbi:MAG: 16S rRNA (guanine(966)-N(2))-methyltransferase RsmD [Candidatus Omnitrophica bacterium]|nr:16S rRNA (guanine(966)-N(2))-methyltransferase RsmD [Candidatus Omnitrophota bacterium]